MYTNANICHSLTVVIILFVVVAAVSVAVLILFDGEKRANYGDGECRMLQKFLHLNCLFVGWLVGWLFRLLVRSLSNSHLKMLSHTHLHT